MSDNNAAASADPVIFNDAISTNETGFSNTIGDELTVSNENNAKPQEREFSLDDAAYQEKKAAPESKQELKEQVEEAIEQGASEKEIKDIIEEFELKVNGKTVKKKLNMSDKEAIKKELQLAAAAQPAMQRAKELEKAYERELNRLMQNPWEVLQELGLNPEELSTQFLEKKVEEMKKSPAEIEKEKLELEVKKYREDMKRMQEESERARLEQLQEQEAVTLEKEIMEALDNHKALPKSQRTVSRIADAMLWAIENGFENVSVADVLPAVEADLRSEIGTFINELPDEMFEEWVGKKKLETYRKQRLASAGKPKAPVNTEVKPTVQSVKKEVEQKKNQPKKKMRDYFDEL
jgi:hypothetical protein